MRKISRIRTFIGVWIFITTHILYGNVQASTKTSEFTLLNKKAFQITMIDSDRELFSLLHQLEEEPLSSQKEEKLIYIVEKFLDRPYVMVGAQGEGMEGNHLQEDPLYRTDGFNCTTFVEMGLALLNARDLPEFKKNWIEISYGAGHLPEENALHYCNRNHFISKDFNPINQKNHRIQEATFFVTPKEDIQRQETFIDSLAWIEAKMDDKVQLRNTIRVTSKKKGNAILKTLSKNNEETYCPQLKGEEISLPYIPKEQFFLKDSIEKRTFQPNPSLLNLIPTPAILEIVRDDNAWGTDSGKVKEIMGTGILVSHLGFLYRKNFKEGEKIYNKILCTSDAEKPLCQVIPVKCEKQNCSALMFAHATDAYPKDYFYYKTSKGYVCQKEKPPKKIPYTTCNRVVAMPLMDYLKQEDSGHFIYLEDPSFLGINIQKIL